MATDLQKITSNANLNGTGATVSSPNTNLQHNSRQVSLTGKLKKIGFFVGDVDAYTCARALEEISKSKLKDKIDVGIFTEETMANKATADFIRSMDVAVVDIMPPKPGGWFLENSSFLKSDVKLYAVRSSSHNQDFTDAGFIMDQIVRSYFGFTSAENLANLIFFLADRDMGINYQDSGLGNRLPPPVVPPENALYHPDAPKLFSSLKEYVKWYKESGHFSEKGLWNLSIIFPTFALEGKNAPLKALINAYEMQGINTVTWFREIKDRDKSLEHLISTEPLASRLGSISGFDFRFSSTLTDGLADLLKKINVPLFNAQYLFFNTKEEWLASPQGVSASDITLQFSTPEISGLVEPTVIGVKERVSMFSQAKESLSQNRDSSTDAYIYTPVAEKIETLARRAVRWHTLRQKSNADKKIVLVYYNHGAGKQNIGASYLNVFKSINTIIQNLKKEGYTIKGDLTEEKVKDLLLKSGRNIGSWAPGELDELIAQGNAAFIQMEDYRNWLAQTPPEFREAVEKDWGKPEDGNIMLKDGRFVIPCVTLGNLVLVPQPVRGWSDDPEKLYHSTVLYPHHQYTAFYLWLQNIIQPDAMISLGTHGTHEWLPGKQAGLSYKCPPEVLIGDIPNIYPYIVDDVGEGIQAKRRGRAVVIDHAVPPFKQGGVYGEYSKLAALISEFESSSSDKIRSSKFERIKQMVLQLGLDKDLELNFITRASSLNASGSDLQNNTLKPQNEASKPQNNRSEPYTNESELQNMDSDLEKIEHYLLTLKAQMVPYGLHTFGVSPSGEALAQTAAAISEKNPDSISENSSISKKLSVPERVVVSGEVQKKRNDDQVRKDQFAQFYEEQIMACGPSEISSLLRSLSGGYVPSGSGNDPVRNPESLPTGKNFYGFDPEKTPSKEAWENGKKAAQDIIAGYQKKHDGKYPEQVGVILWSVETIRDEGINISTALYLMGMTPVWDHRDKVRDVVPIAGSELKRPRIDVLLQMSGLFRDSFPTVALLLDKAVKRAATLTDIENYLRKHSTVLEESLIKNGYSASDAKKISLIRLFSAPPGAYGTKVSNMASASGLWEKDDIVAEQGFVQMQSFGYSSDMWGDKMTPVYRKHLKNVDATLHTISSNLYGTMDNDDMFQYLGGLSMAVKKESGKDPDVFVSMQREKGDGHIENLATTLGKEIRSRYLNPAWIEGMKKESYAGAREMAQFMENMWGWQVTTPEAVDNTKWEQTFEVYVEDKHGLEIKEFFNKENPWAYQSMTARMLEAVRKKYWSADEKITKKLAAEYALNVVEKGVACCDHTCNNPVLNQMVVSIISIPGVLSPDIVEKFTIAIEKATGTPLDKQVQERHQLLETLQKNLAASAPDSSMQKNSTQPADMKPDRNASKNFQTDSKDIMPDKATFESAHQVAQTTQKATKEDKNKTADVDKNELTDVAGYKMEEIKSEEISTSVNSSGIQWFAALFILLLIILFLAGTQLNGISHTNKTALSQ